jgi:hypothetical protein
VAAASIETVDMLSLFAAQVDMVGKCYVHKDSFGWFLFGSL